MVLGRPPKMCNFIEWRDKKIVYKRYASLFSFRASTRRTTRRCAIGEFDGASALERSPLAAHHTGDDPPREVLDRYFGNVCELDIIFNFHKVHTP